MTPHRLIDSHIHLWPAAEANANQHGWMKGSPLAKQYSIDEYLVATGETNLKVEDRQLKGVVYIETDRRLQEEGNIEVWTGKTLDELRFLRRIAEGTPKDAEGHNKEHSGLLLAIVAWAPIHRGQDVFQKYLELAREVAGPKTFARIKAFRFLLQGIRDEKMFRDITLSESTIQTLKSFKRNGNDFAFDVGVDQRQGGISQLETAVEMIKRVHEGEEEDDKVVFVLNHLCKPDLENILQTPEQIQAFSRWQQCMQRFARFDKVYMKLSGAFSELPQQHPHRPLSVTEIVVRMEPWLDCLFNTFSPGRIMFGSNWPVDNIRGPGDKLSWMNWKLAVERMLHLYSLGDEAQDKIWFGTAKEAYNIDLI